ncbi:hypothetical protein O1D29_000800 [Vibrio cholerae]|uniref:hypothetical protein n=1 Tax=Vibrio cholerae TaxID=666 RepID=UPI002B28453C|nr:hypothetical protein [Vibrio cholerae]EKF9851385.1 hypothetical protein [Vibrio cholerae]BER94690.1 hypothetical protein VNVC001_10110 [Vibrio cholerae]BER94699.1 hypothetical protein VNVC001_10200 [Vibrio cholerae]
MEQIVITANQLATLIEASYFYNFVAVLSALLVYDVLGAFFAFGLSNLRAYLEKRSSKEDH